jgi:hypothetical protein
MARTNKDVAVSFLHHTKHTSSTKNFHSDGVRLWSYNTVIAQWDGDRLIVNATKYSSTTSCQHMSPLKNTDAFKSLSEAGQVVYTDGYVPFNTQDLRDKVLKEEEDTNYLKYDDLRKLIKDLAKSQGYYGRLNAELEDDPGIRTQLKRLAREKKFKEPLDFILYLEG